MNTVIILILILILGGICLLAYKMFQTQQSPELSLKDNKIGELTTELQKERSEKDEFQGKNKAMYAEVVSLKADYKNLSLERDRLSSELARFKEEEARKSKESDDRISKLEEARAALEDEKVRIRREDLEREEKEKAERDRMWAEHEEVVKSKMLDLCKLPQFNFNTYDNNNLPEGFTGKLKPDFMIEFLGQYVIFDAKVSKSDNLQRYISENVKKTVEKIEGNEMIYNMVFFVVPTIAMADLTNTSFFEKGYQFYIIPVDAIQVVLAAFKKISAYELAEQMDPRDRENIVNIIAEFDYHINMRNALDILATQSGVSVLEKAGILQADFKKEIELKKSKMRLQQYSPTEIKTLMISTDVQQSRVDELRSPKASVPKSSLDSLKPIVEE